MSSDGTEKKSSGSSTTGEKRKYISIAAFDKKARLVKGDHISKWGDLPVGDTYFINGVRERLVNINGKNQISRHAELDVTSNGERKNKPNR